LGPSRSGACRRRGSVSVAVDRAVGESFEREPMARQRWRWVRRSRGDSAAVVASAAVSVAAKARKCAEDLVCHLLDGDPLVMGPCAQELGGFVNRDAEGRDERAEAPASIRSSTEARAALSSGGW
jgi:hypothetical protein